MLGAATGTAGAATVCDPNVVCQVTFGQLHADILNPDYVPAPSARFVLNTTATVAERLTPTDPCQEAFVLGVFQREVDFFADNGFVTSTGRSVLTTDATGLVPPNPITPPSPICN